MAEPFLGEIRLFSLNFAPNGWALCNGQLLPINQNQALFALLGTTYGGNGTTTFALPDLRGRMPRHVGPQTHLGQAGGDGTVTLASQHLPAHGHTVSALPIRAGAGTTEGPGGNYLGASGREPMFANAAGPERLATLDADNVYQGQVSTVGGNESHQNMSPYLTISFCIALQGIFPSPN
ncbi:MAG: phage tail protein [Ectothiorhodospiraceae bacterium]|nr:phage tail protein [Ectothiorhodospiraceae bacterium]MCH8505569.1 tail fiber protein [Ectothiorhodospiraceae bacterium]